MLSIIFHKIIYIPFIFLYFKKNLNIGVIYTVLCFSSKDIKIQEQLTLTLMIFIIVIQSIMAFHSITIGIKENNYNIFRRYLVWKIIYIFFNFLQVENLKMFINIKIKINCFDFLFYSFPSYFFQQIYNMYPI